MMEPLFERVRSTIPRGDAGRLGAARRSARWRGGALVGWSAGFTLIELMVVIALIAIASAVVSLSLRDPAATRLEHEGARLVALLEIARSESRAWGLTARWEPRAVQEGAAGFRFVGLPPSSDLPTHWLGAGVTAEVPGARAVVLGPEPLIGAQTIVLRLDDQRLTLATDGLGPFVVDTVATAALP